MHYPERGVSVFNMQIPFFKTCAQCKQTKFITDFSKASHKPDGRNIYCKSCTRGKSKHWREQNTEHRLDYGRNYYRENQDYFREYYESNKEHIKELSQKWYAANKDRKSESRQQWLSQNIDSYREYQKQWRKDNPDKVRTYEHRHDKRQKDNGGCFTSDEWLALCERYDNRCVCCKQHKPLTVDHVIPVVKGGTSDISNIQPLCKSCNSKKRDKTMDFR